MFFPGNNTLTLTEDAIRVALEATFNEARREGEPFVRVVEMKMPGWSSSDWKLTITTDAPTAEVVEPVDPGKLTILDAAGKVQA